MRILKVLLSLALIVGVSGCASKFKTYRGPEVTQVIVYKEKRRMRLMHDRRVLKSYDFDLGFAPVGDKKVEGDGKTPEGNYIIDRRNPNSKFHLSLGINYPNARDIAEAKALGQSPGGDIFIHGQPNISQRLKPDWTAGCISVTNKEIEKIYAMIRNGTPIAILP